MSPLPPRPPRPSAISPPAAGRPASPACAAVGEWTESSRDLREGLVVVEHGMPHDWDDYVMPTPVVSEDWSKLVNVR